MDFIEERERPSKQRKEFEHRFMKHESCLGDIDESHTSRTD